MQRYKSSSSRLNINSVYVRNNEAYILTHSFVYWTVYRVASSGVSEDVRLLSETVYRIIQCFRMMGKKSASEYLPITYIYSSDWLRIRADGKS